MSLLSIIGAVSLVVSSQAILLPEISTQREDLIAAQAEFELEPLGPLPGECLDLLGGYSFCKDEEPEVVNVKPFQPAIRPAPV